MHKIGKSVTIAVKWIIYLFRSRSTITKSANYKRSKGFNNFYICIRYEREEVFFALNVTVKNATLQDSLAQYVKGELLEGDNAYFCEKCGAKVRGSVLLYCRWSEGICYCCVHINVMVPTSVPFQHPITSKSNMLKQTIRGNIKNILLFKIPLEIDVCCIGF